MMGKNLIYLILLWIISMGGIAEAKTSIYLVPWFGWWGYPAFNISFSKGIDGQLSLGTSIPLWWGYNTYYYHPYNYGRVVINDPEPDEPLYEKGSYTPNVIQRGEDIIFYGGIQIYPAGRVKITTTDRIPDKSETLDIEIDGYPAGKTRTGEKPFEIGLLVGRHKISIKRDGKEVFSAEINVERNKDISLKIDPEGLNN